MHIKCTLQSCHSHHHLWNYSWFSNFIFLWWWQFSACSSCRSDLTWLTDCQWALTRNYYYYCYLSRRILSPLLLFIFCLHAIFDTPNHDYYDTLHCDLCLCHRKISRFLPQPQTQIIITLCKSKKTTILQTTNLEKPLDFNCTFWNIVLEEKLDSYGIIEILCDVLSWWWSGQVNFSLNNLLHMFISIMSLYFYKINTLYHHGKRYDQPPTQ